MEEEKSAEVKETETTATPEVNPVVVEVKEEEAAPQVEKVDAVQVKGAQTDATQPEQTAQKPDEETWKMIGNVCLTPCGHGVISSRTDDNRAAVILIAA